MKIAIDRLIGENIQKVRIDQRLSIHDLSMDAQISVDRLSEIESGDTRATAEELFRLTRALGAKATDFYSH